MKIFTRMVKKQIGSYNNFLINHLNLLKEYRNITVEDWNQDRTIQNHQWIHDFGITIENCYQKEKKELKLI